MQVLLFPLRLRVLPGSLLLLLLLGMAAPALSQGVSGTLEGRALGAQDGSPLSFSFVRLLPAEGSAIPERGVLADAEGRFRFDRVPAGEYRLQVEQIGYQTVFSPVLRVHPGETLHHELRSTIEPIQLAGITVRLGSRCLSLGQLGEDPVLSVLWDEAQKGVEARRAFERQYRFAYNVRQEVETRVRFGRATPVDRDETVLSEPDSVLAREQRRQAERQAQGYGSQSARSFSLSLPNEKELLDDEFLRDHCLETAVEEAEGAWALRFRPVQSRRNQIGIRGTIWIEADTYRIRRLEFEHVRGNRSLAQSHIDYADIQVDGSSLRFPSVGRITGRPGGMVGMLITGFEATFTFQDYRDFEPVSNLNSASVCC